MMNPSGPPVGSTSVGPLSKDPQKDLKEDSLVMKGTQFTHWVKKKHVSIVYFIIFYILIIPVTELSLRSR